MIFPASIHRGSTIEISEGDGQIVREALGELHRIAQPLHFVLDLEKLRLLYLSGPFELLFGQPIDSLSGKADVWLGMLVHEDRESAISFLQNPESNDYVSHVIRLNLPCGRRRALRVTAVRKQIAGRLIVTGSAAEIKLGEPSFFQSDLHRVAVESTHEGVGMTDGNGNYVYLNRQHLRMFGYQRPEQLIGKSWRLLYDDETIREIEVRVFPELQATGVWHGRLRAIRRDGTPFHLDLTLSLLPDGGIICNCRDATSVVEQETNLMRQREAYQVMQREFISMVSHEFRTPLTSIRAVLHLLRLRSRRLPNDQIPDWLRLFGMQEAACETLVNLVEQVLLLNRIDHVSQEPPKHKVVLVDFVINIINKIHSSLEVDGVSLEKRLVLDYDLSDDYHTVIDEPQMRAAIENLVSNALKYSPEATEVRVTLRGNENFWELKVVDRGIGIPPEDLDKLFRPFHRAVNVGQVPGTGLGLTIIQRVANYHRGAVRVDSVLGSGTTFTLEIPRHPKTEPTQETSYSRHPFIIPPPNIL
jgi:PAS domain S-box-containing protein